MLKLIRLKLLIVPVAVCLLLFVAFGGTAFASSAGTRPHLSGAENVNSTAGCANIHIRGTDFFPSTTTTTNYADVFTIASTDHNASGNTVVPVNSHGSFSTIFTVCGLGFDEDRIEYIAQDGTTGFYTNVVFTTSD